MLSITTAKSGIPSLGLTDPLSVLVSYAGRKPLNSRTGAIPIERIDPVLMLDPRTLLLFALLLDWVGQVLILALMLSMPAWIGMAHGFESLQEQGSWLVFVLLLYPLLGWLFGSFTVLRWRRLPYKCCWRL